MRDRQESAPATPFLRWVGGKRQILPALVSFLPERYGHYFEPFIGGGALFFHLCPTDATLSDMNVRLVRTYRALRDDVERVIVELKDLREAHEQQGKDFFLKVRAFPIDAVSDAKVAAWFIYLNRTCFNGVYRVNRDGGFNVPFGDNPNATICDEDNLRRVSRALETVELRHQDFSYVLAQARPGDFVYFDPPYVPLSATSAFTSYTAEGFGMEDQRRLRDLALGLQARGVHVVLSNSSAPAVMELYEGWQIDEVAANRSLNCKVEGRGAVKEVIIRQRRSA